MKTIDKLKEVGFTYNVEGEPIDILIRKSKLKQSAIEDIKELLKEIIIAPDRSERYDNIGIKAKIEYIKEKFNITEKEIVKTA